MPSCRFIFLKAQKTSRVLTAMDETHKIKAELERWFVYAQEYANLCLSGSA